MAIGPRFPMPDIRRHRVPREWQHLVCTCMVDHGTFVCERFDEGCIELHCRGCKLFMRFYASYCLECGKFYLMLFKCAEWSPKLNVCWDCLKHEHQEGKCRAPLPEIEPQQPKSLDELAAALADAFK